MSTIYVDNLQPNLGSRVMAAGHVVQVVSATNPYPATVQSTTFVDVSGLSVNITPTSATSKILVLLDYKGDAYSHGSGRLLRNGVAIGVGAADGSRTRASFQFANPSSQTANQYHRIHSQTVSVLDEPSTTGLLTYKVQIAVPWSSSYVITCNKSINDTNNAYDGRTSSSITLMEIAQ